MAYPRQPWWDSRRQGTKRGGLFQQLQQNASPPVTGQQQRQQILFPPARANALAGLADNYLGNDTGMFICSIMFSMHSPHTASHKAFCFPLLSHCETSANFITEDQLSGAHVVGAYGYLRR